MPRNGAGQYQRPTGTEAVSGELISSADYESQMNDLATDANDPRPVAAGGTGVATLAAFRTAAGLVIGTDIQAQNVKLQSIANLTLLADKGVYATGASTFATFDLPALSRSFLANTTTAGQRTSLGLGGLATQNILNEPGLVTSSETRPPSQNAIKIYITDYVADRQEALAVGSYAMMRALLGGPHGNGSLLAGSNLSPADADGRPQESGGSIVTATGNWRCMGSTSEAGVNNNSAAPRQTTLWVRYS